MQTTQSTIGPAGDIVEMSAESEAAGSNFHARFIEDVRQLVQRLRTLKGELETLAELAHQSAVMLNQRELNLAARVIADTLEFLEDADGL